MSIAWEQELDPSEKLDYEANFGGDDKPLLEVAETIATFTIAVTAAAAALGLQVESIAPYAPALTADSKGIKLWLSVASGLQSSGAFDAGVALGVIVTVVTNSNPARTRQRTWVATVRQQ